MTTKKISLNQMINAERWLSTEIDRLKKEGHQIVGDSVLINMKGNSHETVSRPA